MDNYQPNNTPVILMVLITLCGAASLLIFPDIFPGIWQILAWVAVGLSAIGAVLFNNVEKSKKALAKKALEKKRYKRRKKINDDKVKQEERIQESKEKLAKKEEKQAEKRAKVKAKIIEESEAVWQDRVEHAKQKEEIARDIISKTNQMPVRTAAGHVAIEWNEITTLAQWTIQQIMMFSRRPNVTMEAREEAQEAIIESMKIKDSGGLWTQEQGEELAKVKEKARLEALIEEDRIDTIRNTIENAELKWRAAERRADRWQSELDKINRN